MGPENKKKYLDLVDEELMRKQKSLESIEHGRNTAESAMTSHHDHLRSDLAQDASILQGVMDNLVKFRTFVDEAGPCTKIQEGAEFKATLVEEEDTLEAIFSPVTIIMPGIRTVSPQSPLGQVIKNLQQGDAFFYGPDKTKQMLGLVDSVE